MGTNGTSTWLSSRERPLEGFSAYIIHFFSGQWNLRSLEESFQAIHQETLSFADIFLEDVSDGHRSRALRVSLPQKLRFTLLLSDPAGQDKQCVTEAIQKTHESGIQTLLPPQSHTDTFSPSTDCSGLV